MASRRVRTGGRHTRRGGTSRRSLLGLGVLGTLAAGAAGYGWYEAGRLPASANGSRVAARFGDAPAPTAPPRPDPVAQQRERAVRAAQQVRRYAADLPGQLSVAVVDQGTGTGFRIGDGLRFQTASIVKVDILAALLLQQGRLTGAQRRTATRMITVSDNAAASDMFAQVGGVSGLNRANAALGMTETRPTPSWGTTTTTAADQIRLMRALAGDDGPLGSTERELVLELMGDVVAEQRWGVSAGASSAGSRVWVKNGWVTVDEHDGRWLVNSIGRIAEGDRDWLVAILSDRHDTFDAGVAVVEQVARTAFDAWRD
ncbi:MULTISPECIES: serine hydrolase [unclassified Solwaraspora]|uniref:serine hydrolase n=1 Tax=unclassified Solwaraspora TaxID=2627926 RepID=UPI00259B9945|nr:serine hydrolase [Solwaraspora sp. WMMA2056]WJK39123.1 serine hydrolase [Solwaraspora sp. WMMA2056]